jgi:hypothetical protein
MREEMYGCGTKARWVLRTEWIILMRVRNSRREKHEGLATSARQSSIASPCPS